MVRSLTAFRLLLGTPTYRSVVSDRREGQRFAAHWSCGCIASGPTFIKLTLRPCRSHNTERSAREPIGLL